VIIDYEVVDKIKLEITDNFPLILIWFCSVPVLSIETIYFQVLSHHYTQKTVAQHSK